MTTVVMYNHVTFLNYNQTRPSVPPKNPLIILRKLNPLLVVDFRLTPCILACVMSREFTREAVMKFLPARFS